MKPLPESLFFPKLPMIRRSQEYFYRINSVSTRRIALKKAFVMTDSSAFPPWRVSVAERWADSDRRRLLTSEGLESTAPLHLAFNPSFIIWLSPCHPRISVTPPASLSPSHLWPSDFTDVRFSDGAQPWTLWPCLKIGNREGGRRGGGGCSQRRGCFQERRHKGGLLG